jgi:predicted ABC-type transport system involved in lysophospholipase L1 biosynthesis ATPase subunit
MSAQWILALEGVRKSYPAPVGAGEIPILRGVELSVAPGESIAVTGPSGSGKSTLLNLMGLLDLPDSGRVMLDGNDAAAWGDAERARMRNRRIGFVFQLHHLLPSLSVMENVLVPAVALPRGDPRLVDVEARAARLVDRVGLGPRKRHHPSELSGGECLRAAVARAMVNGPALLLADEPTGSLDAETAKGVVDLLVELNREESVTLVVVTHSVDLAARMARRLVLRNGAFTA